jgi:hypothetical protein
MCGRITARKLYKEKKNAATHDPVDVECMSSEGEKAREGGELHFREKVKGVFQYLKEKTGDT